MNTKAVQSMRARPAICWSVLSLIMLLGFIVSLRAETEAPLADSDHSPYHVALLNYKQGNFEAARTAIDAAEKAKPGDLAVEVLKARILIEQHQFAEGEKLLRKLLTPNAQVDVQLALGDLFLRKRDFDNASKCYEQVLQIKPNNPDVMLKLIYARVSVSDFVAAGKYASQLKPLDADHPSYYFAKAAIAQATGKTSEADQDIETVRTIYGITETNRYLKTYLQVFTPAQTASPSSRAEPPKTEAAPAGKP